MKFNQKDIKSINKSGIEDNIAYYKDVETFKLHGLSVFVGMQGQGKTITMIYQLINLKRKYPKATVYANMKLNVDFEYNEFTTIQELQFILRTANNGKYGVIICIDEIQSYFNSLQSKYLAIEDITAICQQRKRHMCVLGTVQLFNRLAKAFREQCSRVVKCNTHFNYLTTFHAFDGTTLELDENGKYCGQSIGSGFFFQSRELRNSYDTYATINLQIGGSSSMYSKD